MRKSEPQELAMTDILGMRAMTWLVKVALDRPYTFIVMALMILIFGPLAAIRTPTDIFPNIGIPVLGVAFSYAGLSPDEMGARLWPVTSASFHHVNDVEHVESQSMPGWASSRSISSPMSISAWPPRRSPRSRRRPSARCRRHPAALIINYSASTVPVLQMAFSSTRCPNSRCWTIRRISPARA
jgi:hypothetical protein